VLPRSPLAKDPIPWTRWLLSSRSTGGAMRSRVGHDGDRTGLRSVGQLKPPIQTPVPSKARLCPFAPHRSCACRAPY
jgi:hypothetical protein